MPIDLQTAGRVLFGKSWRAHLARALDIDPSTIWRWTHGQMPPPEHPVWRTLSETIKQRRDELNALLGE